MSHCCTHPLPGGVPVNPTGPCLHSHSARAHTWTPALPLTTSTSVLQPPGPGPQLRPCPHLGHWCHCHSKCTYPFLSGTAVVLHASEPWLLHLHPCPRHLCHHWQKCPRSYCCHICTCGPHPVPRGISLANTSPSWEQRTRRSQKPLPPRPQQSLLSLRTPGVLAATVSASADLR